MLLNIHGTGYHVTFLLVLKYIIFYSCRLTYISTYGIILIKLKYII